MSSSQIVLDVGATGVHQSPVNASSEMNDDEPAASAVPSRRQQAIGVSLVVSVAVIWVVSAEFIQYIFADPSSDYNKPYTLSYTCVSLFFVFLLGFIKPSWRAIFHNTAEYETLDDSATSDSAPSSAKRNLSLRQVVQLAAILAPLFFVCNWTFNLGLAYTSVSSSSIIATLTSLFTLILGAVTGVERFSVSKSVAALISVVGAMIIILADDTSSKDTTGSNPLFGDFVSVVSAVIYATYTTILKAKAPTEGSVNVAMLLSFIGLMTALAGWPGIAVLDWTNIEQFEWPSRKAAILLVIQGLIGTVLSDFLWALSVVLTTPLTTTLSLSLTVPLSIIIDVLWGRKSFSIWYFVGATLVFSGFILINLAVSCTRRLQGVSQTS